MGQTGQDENAGKAPADAVVPADDKKDPVVDERRVAEALELAASARGTYQRLQKEFGNVAGAEESVYEARKARSALEPPPTESGALSMISIGALGIIALGARRDWVWPAAVAEPQRFGTRLKLQKGVTFDDHYRRTQLRLGRH